ncbi:MAG: enoyl-CoA hydratase [Acidibacillus sp.]|uniref:1,2-epoxyphenylacetyl-CoA isomerase n=1 Tax=Sulfoacidibacillus ferrooxidans TaxID=2005001 RepID=A0A9X1V9P7_9BACL|nr:enoyl-CoA hydratase [Sulfoacidibacillus ferrooxidans]MCI0182683.1 1,2-epoxyphenylacetyl-CoA isomerase [Sulfoacidibacillus ferrooxidans]MCY0893335.1 enoyl-CoA hydratase [Acidibacillus sp.]
MVNEDLLVHKNGAILELTLNRPDRLNAFSEEMVVGLMEACKEAQRDASIRVVVLSGAGRSFSAGGDVKTMGEASPVQVYEHIGKLNECIVAMRELEKPIIAVVHGFAAGAGFNLALASDLIVASTESRFVLSFAQVGLISDGGGSYFLPRLVGPHVAKELFFLADPLSAQRAYELGIVNRVVPQEQLREEAANLAERLANGPGRAYGMMKRLIDRSFHSTLDGILQDERTVQGVMVTTHDHQEGVAAFIEKRKPHYTGQ